MPDGTGRRKRPDSKNHILTSASSDTTTKNQYYNFKNQNQNETSGIWTAWEWTEWNKCDARSLVTGDISSLSSLYLDPTFHPLNNTHARSMPTRTTSWSPSSPSPGAATSPFPPPPPPPPLSPTKEPSLRASTTRHEATPRTGRFRRRATRLKSILHFSPLFPQLEERPRVRAPRRCILLHSSVKHLELQKKEQVNYQFAG